MVRLLLLFIAILTPYICSAAMNESDTLRCRNSLVSKGDSKYEVTEKCGEPARKEHITYYGTYSRKTVEQWTYDFGPQEFVYLVRFESNGAVSHMYNTGNYGIKRN
jgi:ribosomal protein L32